MRLFFVIFLVLFVFFSPPARALSGENLLKFCSVFMDEIAADPKDMSMRSLFCLYYVAGAVDMIEMNQTFGWGTVCRPNVKNYDPIIAAIVNHLKANPKEWEYTAIAPVVLAIKENWPCEVPQ